MKNAVGEVQGILVLGGRSEIGAAIARHVCSPFTTKIVLAGRQMKSNEASDFLELLPERERHHVRVEVAEFDAVDFSSHPRIASDLIASGDIDLVVVAFGQLGDPSLVHHDPVAAAGLISVNFGGVVSIATAVAEEMTKLGRGHIVFVSSVAGERTRKGNYVYGSSKAGMDAFAQGLGDALEDAAVSVTIVRPGFVRTAMTKGLRPAPFAIDADDVGRTVALRMKQGRRIIWAPGILRYVFMLFRHLPSVVWRRLPIN